MKTLLLLAVLSMTSACSLLEDNKDVDFGEILNACKDAGELASEAIRICGDLGDEA